MSDSKPFIGVLALQGAFEEHQKCLEAVGCRTKQIRTAADMNDIDGIVLPGGESTAMGLIGTASVRDGKNVWEALKEFTATKPVWGTCAGMILLADRCVGASAVIQNGQSLIGGMDILVCRNYFGSQISSFEMAIPAPPCDSDSEGEANNDSYPGVFIRAPAILDSGEGVKVLGRVVATPCRQAAVVLDELETKIKNGEKVIQLGVVDALERDQGLHYKVVVKPHETRGEEETKEGTDNATTNDQHQQQRGTVSLPGAPDGSNAREVICAVQKDHILCTAFHPELTDDYRWHAYFAKMVAESKSS